MVYAGDADRLHKGFPMLWATAIHSHYPGQGNFATRGARMR